MAKTQAAQERLKTHIAQLHLLYEILHQLKGFRAYAEHTGKNDLVNVFAGRIELIEEIAQERLGGRNRLALEAAFRRDRIYAAIVDRADMFLTKFQ